MKVLKKVGGLVMGAVGAVVGFIAAGPAGAAVGFGVGMGIGSVAQMAAMQGSIPATSSATSSRLNISIDPDAYRKIAFGETALGTDQVYWETWGPENSYFDQVIVAAGHKIEEFGDLYFDDELINFSSTAATGAYSGALWKQDRRVGVSGGSSISIGDGTKWTAAASLTGMAYYGLKIRWSQEKFPRGIPNRVTRIGKGALVYDPRRDSTVPGGSGTHRADDQDTWQYTPLDSNGQPIGRNPALQILWYEIGWRVQNPVTGEWVLVCGRGRPLDDIDFESFVTAANDCEEQGYYSDVLLSTGDAHETNIAVLEAACAGKLMDPGGRVSLYIRTDTTGDIVQAFTDGNVLDSEASVWRPSLPLSQRWNQGKGSFVDARALYQVTPLPTVRDPAYEAEDGFKRAGPEFRFDAVQDPEQGQDLIRLELNISRYQGVFTAPFDWRAKKVRIWDCVTLTFPRLGFDNKIFRVLEKKTDPMGAIWLLLREDDPSIYTKGTVNPVPAPAAGAGYDPRVVTAPDAGDWSLIPSYIEGGGAKIPKLGISGTVPASNIVAVHLYFRQGVSGDWISQGRYSAAGTVRSERTSIALNTSYYARIVYENAYGVLSAPTDIGPYTSPADFEALTAQIADGIIDQGWGATASESEASNARHYLSNHHVEFGSGANWSAASYATGGSPDSVAADGTLSSAFYFTTAGSYGPAIRMSDLGVGRRDLKHAGGIRLVPGGKTWVRATYDLRFASTASHAGRATLGVSWFDKDWNYLGSSWTTLDDHNPIPNYLLNRLEGEFLHDDLFANNAAAVYARPFLFYNWNVDSDARFDTYELDWKTSQFGADVTEYNVASGIEDQGSQATANHYRGPTYPGTPTEGSWWSDTTTSQLKLYTGGAWQIVAAISAVTSNDKTVSKVGLAGSGVNTVGTTWVEAVVLTMTVGTSGNLKVPMANVGAALSAAISGGTSFSGNWRVTEATQAAPSTKTVIASGTFTANSGGGGVTVSGFVRPSVLVPATKSGACRYTIEVRRASGATNVTDLSASLGIEWSPAG